MLPYPEDMAPMSPVGDTRCSSVSITRAQCVGNYHLDEVCWRYRSDRSLLVVGCSSVDKEHVEFLVREMFVQPRQLGGLVDVEMLDADAPAGAVRQIVQRCSSGGVSDRADDVPSPVEQLGRHRVTETARRADDQDGRWVPVRAGC